MVLRVARAASLAVLVWLGGAAEARAQAADALLARHAELERELSRPASAARERRLLRLLDRAIDYEMIVRRVLVLHWDGLSEAQRAEVTRLLERAIRQRYRASVEALRGWEVEVVSEAERGVGRQVVTRVRRGDEVRQVAYDLYREGREWRVVDLNVDGESLVHQYRVQFDRVIRRDGWDGFLARLRQRVEAEG